MHWVPTGQTVNKEYYIEVLREFRKRFLGKRPALFKSAQWHFYQDNAPVSILVTEYLTKMCIKAVPHPPYSPDLAHNDFCLFPKLRSCRYGTIEEMKEAVSKVIDSRGLPWDLSEVVGTVEQVHCNWRRLLRRDYSFMCVLSIKVPIRKKSGNLFNDPRNSLLNKDFGWRIINRENAKTPLLYGHNETKIPFR